MKYAYSSFFWLAACASLDDRLCNQTKAFQKGYEDVVEGRVASPGLAEGQQCKKSEKYAYADFHRDYTAGFEKAKLAHCTRANSEKFGQADAEANREQGANIEKLRVCLNDDKRGHLYQSGYDSGYKKAFCDRDRIDLVAQSDARDLKIEPKKISAFEICGGQARALFRAYQAGYLGGVRAECSPSKFSQIGATYAREKRSLAEGYSLVDRCPADLKQSATQAYSTAYQMERDQLMREEMLAIEKRRLEQENENQRRYLELQQQQLDAQKAKPN